MAESWDLRHSEQRLRDLEEKVMEEQKLRKEAELQALEQQKFRKEAEFQALEQQKLRKEAEFQALEQQKLRKEAEFQALEQQKFRKEAEFQALEQQKFRKEAEFQAFEQQKLREEAESRAEKEQQRNRKTNFKEYLEACHNLVHNSLSVETEKSLTSKGGLTDVRRKFYPRALKPWDTFPEEHEKIYGELCEFFHPKDQLAPRVFSPVLVLEDMGETVLDRKIADETDLQIYERTGLENMVTKVIFHLSKIEAAKEYFRLGLGVGFVNHYRPLSDLTVDVRKRLHLQTTQTNPQRSIPPKSSRPGSASSVSSNSASSVSSNSASTVSSDSALKTRPDQHCFYRAVDGRSKRLFVVEYKPPHKLSIDSLQAGFRERSIEEYVNTAEAPVFSDKLVTAVLIQTFHYMIKAGLRYSYITTGQAFIFLHIDWKDPTTVLYHLTVPKSEIDNGAADFVCQRTAVSQVLSLCLMALGVEKVNSKTRRRVQNKKLKTYNPDSYVLPDSVEKPKPSSPAYRGRINPTNRTSPVKTRQSCKIPEQQEPREHRRDDSDSPTPDGPSGSARVVNEKKGKGKASRGAGKDSSEKGRKEDNGRQRQYCTQRCLLGVVRNTPLDEKCPNVSLHRREGMLHALNLQQFMKLVQMQLAEDLDHDCEPLGMEGSRGALFRITLASHGYVFVGKGTVKAFVPDLAHEGAVYRQLDDLQGTAIPVYLGNINLVEWYYLDIDVEILHMLLMSWGGIAVHRDEMTKGWQGLEQEIERTVAEVRRSGIDQGDVRPPNVLWNRELERTMLIDFERAKRIEGVPQKTPPYKERERGEAMKECRQICQQ